MKYFNSIETERLLIRPFSETDNIEKMNWFFDPLVMDQTISNVENDFSIKQRINRYINHQFKYGYSKWLVIYKETGEFIGVCGVCSLDSGNETINDIGYLLASQYWGKGIGIEMTKSFIHAYFENLSFDLLYAHTKLENKISINLLSKLGFSFEKPAIVHGAALNRYCLERNSFEVIFKTDKELI